MITSILVLLIVVLGAYIASHNLNGAQLAAALAILVVGVVLVISPDLASYTAKFLNVGRGSDLVVYLMLMLGLFVAANFYFRFKKTEQQQIEIVRALAILNAGRDTKL